MATVTAISSKSGDTKAAVEYITQDKKTANGKFISCLNCSPQTILEEFQNTKLLHKKTDGVQFYHFVQSHPKGFAIAPELAHRIAVEFAERAFGGFECVVATHLDAEHTHSHFVFNSVSLETGLKYHSNKFTLNDLRELSDEICLKYGIPVLDKPDVKKEQKGLSAGEKQAAMRGESWKITLMSTITDVMKIAKSKKHFIFLMSSLGYQVRWEGGRKYITYTCPNGKKCRDNKLHLDKFGKEKMENEFKLRDRIFDEIKSIGPREGAEYLARGHGAGAELESNNRTAGANGGNRGTAFANRAVAFNERVGGSIDSSNDGLSEQIERGNGAENSISDFENRLGDEGLAATGWEPERQILLSIEQARRIQGANERAVSENAVDFAGGVLGAVGAAVGLIALTDDEQEGEPPKLTEHIDKKEYEKIARKKAALGLKMGQ